LIVGRGHYHSDRWILLAVLLVIDLISTPLLNGDLMRKDSRFGNPGKKIAKEIGEEGKKWVLKGVGFPEHLVEGYLLSKEASPAESRSGHSFRCRMKSSQSVSGLLTSTICSLIRVGAIMG